MIIIKLKGGLGNQLFQYSLGRHLAQRQQTDLKLDIRGYEGVPNRQYDLGHFNIVASMATLVDIQGVQLTLSHRLKNIIRPYYRRTSVGEQSFNFDPNILAAGPDAYLDGYWQSEHYFSDIADTIRHDLTLKTAPSSDNAEILKNITTTTAVSLHVRRGDYVSSQATNQFHGTCSLEYYQQAIRYIAQKVQQPHFYIFSDDPAWTQQHLKITYPTTYVTHNGTAAQEDLRLMSQCQHHIIANSTFSWWGAWLNPSVTKLVIAPKKWFNDDKINTQDLLPASWIKL